MESPFDEDAQSNDIVKHLRAHAGSFLDSLGFKLADTHFNKSCLDFESSTIGTITGGTDAMIVPKSLNVDSYGHQACVLFEWKTPNDLEAHFEESTAQAKVELIAARCLSRQPLVSVVLTDMTSRAIIYQFAFNESENKFYIKTMCINVKQICQYVFSFLQAHAEPSPLFTPSADSERAIEHALVARRNRRRFSGEFSSSESFSNQLLSVARSRACTVPSILTYFMMDA